LNFGSCLIAGLIELDVPPHIIKLLINRSHDLIGVDKTKPSEISLLTLVEDHQLFLMLPPSLSNDAPFVDKK
jgi:hypothetical protein